MSTTAIASTPPLASTPTPAPSSIRRAEPAPRVVIVAAVDRSEPSHAAIHSAAAIARSMPGAELHTLYVIPMTSPPTFAVVGGGINPSLHALFQEGRAFIDNVSRQVAAEEHFEGRVCAHLVGGQPASHILQLASDLQADVIVVGAHNQNALERLVLGSVSQTVAKKARCSVIIARPKAYAGAKDSAAHTPEIEPPCDGCLETQRASGGEKLWCAHHAQRHAHATLHYETPQSFAMGSMFIR